MIGCYDEGTLRAYLDDMVAASERHVIRAHLAGCLHCQRHVAQLRMVSAQVTTLLDTPVQTVDPSLALARLRQAQQAKATAQGQPIHIRGPQMLWRTLMHHMARFWTGPRRMVATGLAAVVIMLSLLAFPPVRAVANRMLDVFRVQRVLLMPISPERIAQLESLDFDGKTLFVAEPKLVNQPAPPRTVTSAAEASGAVGFPVQEPTVFPGDPTNRRTVVLDRTVYQFQVNLESARQLLELLDVHDVTLPDSLGAQPITADMSSWVESRYQGSGYELELYQGHSPTMTLPEGTNLQQLGRAALRLLGMDPAKADALSRQIDWSSTFVFPIPPGVTDLRQVTVGDAQGMLVGAQDDGDQHWLLYWQDADRFYVLQGRGTISEIEMLAAANSVR